MKIEFLGVKIDNLNQKETLEKIDALIQEGRRGKRNYVVKPNPEILVLANKDQGFRQILNKASLAVPDGFGLLLASRLLKNPLKERVGDAILMEKIIEMCAGKGYSIYLFGGRPPVVERLANKIKEKYQGINLVSYHHGYALDDNEVIDDIKKYGPDVVFVAIGFPKQEKWIERNLEKVHVPLMIAEGGSFDFLSGGVARAPVFIRKIGLEWLFRLIKQPWRFKRQLAIPIFTYLIAREKLRNIFQSH